MKSCCIVLNSSLFNVGCGAVVTKDYSIINGKIFDDNLVTFLVHT